MHRSISIYLILLLVAVACGDGGTDQSVPDPAGPGSDTPTSDGTDEEDAASADSDPERSSVTIASAFLPASLDPADEGYSLIQRGAAETLTRVGHDQSIEPWLAESVDLVEDTTWEIILREDVVFWNGETMTSQHVVDAIERNWSEQPATGAYLPEETDLDIVDDRTLTLTLPEPDSGLPHNLATPNLVIHTMDDETPVMTGPYQPVELRPDDRLVLQPFDDYWGGTPPLAEITVSRVADGNARALAVQSGDVDFITEASPEGALAAGNGVEIHSVDSTRVHHLVMNHDRAPFDDPAVREAIDLAIDRDELNEVALGGLGAPVTTAIPPGIGIDTPDQLELDVDAAETILEEAGWEKAENGVRMKDGQALQFLIYSYPGRPELTPIAVSIQEQLRRIGFEVSVQEVDDVVQAMENANFQAAIFSINMLPTGDPAYALQTLAASNGSTNYGNYQRDEFDDLLRRLRLAKSESERSDLVLQAQQMLADDHGIVFLISTPRVVIYRPDRIEPPELHPSEMYFINSDLPVAVD